MIVKWLTGMGSMGWRGRSTGTIANARASSEKRRRVVAIMLKSFAVTPYKRILKYVADGQ